jgi:hypothetical protein
MKIVITESQYSALLRRFSLSQIEDEFWYRLKKEDPCDYESFNDFLNWVSYRTEDTIHYKIIENEKLKLDLEQERKFRKMILDFIYNNFSDDVKYYYDKYRKIICPKK